MSAEHLLAGLSLQEDEELVLVVNFPDYSAFCIRNCL